MTQSFKRIIQWRSIFKGRLLNETPVGREYDVPGVGYVLVTAMDLEGAQGAGKNPLCRLACYQENTATSRWTILGFGSFRWIESCRRCN